MSSSPLPTKLILITGAAKRCSKDDTYADLRLGGVDASLVAIAERLAVRQVATLDRRRFTVVRPAHCDAFDLLPSG